MPQESKHKVVVVIVASLLLMGIGYLLWPKSTPGPEETITQSAAPKVADVKQVKVDDGLGYFERNAAILPKEAANFKVAMLAFCKTIGASADDIKIDAGSIRMLPMLSPPTENFNTTVFTMRIKDKPYKGRLQTYAVSQVVLKIYDTNDVPLYDSGIVNQIR